MWDIVKKTNGDILGVILFIMLIFYFVTLEKQTDFTCVLLAGSIGALVVDFVVVYKYIVKTYM